VIGAANPPTADAVDSEADATTEEKQVATTPDTSDAIREAELGMSYL